ncbi:MAG: hypothetical protein D3922_01925 [Candidatus Electrothrix sp. AR1]|nr:hypothetical protein [Candidatus Electrothrix sp. AR1]
MRLTILLSFLFAVLCYSVGSDIKISEQLPLYESLRNTSAIIFGVMGAWIAILYPNSLLKIYGKLDAKNSEQEEKKFKQLISPMVFSTVIVSLVLVIGLCAPVLRKVSFLLEYKEVFRSLSFSFLGTLTFLQLWALFCALEPGRGILESMRFTTKKRRKIKQVLPYMNTSDDN